MQTLIKIVRAVLNLFVAPSSAAQAPTLSEGNQLTPHFKLSEFTKSNTAQAHGIINSPTPEHRENIVKLAKTLETVRTLCGNKPLVISSGYRNDELNKLVGGVPNSAHAQGLAVDFNVSGMSTKTLCKKIANSGINFDQLIFEQGGSSWCHLAIGGRQRREVLSWKKGKGYVTGVVKL